MLLKRNFDKNKKTLYLTAHYDSTSDTIGIVDNASGSATLLELARVLSDYNDEFNIGIVFLVQNSILDLDQESLFQALMKMKKLIY